MELGANGADGGFSFNIFASLPDGQQGARQIKVGQLGTFTWPSEGEAMAGTADISRR
ncbi:hypothetical protein [Bradyrhizobium sp. USDA 223]|uniref:hypothetical protein n=1 Tax=Bradyrhizobium sp. USDA 223 TaxID=3156306 RepID=UPI003832A1EC